MEETSVDYLMRKAAIRRMERMVRSIAIDNFLMLLVPLSMGGVLFIGSIYEMEQNMMLAASAAAGLATFAATYTYKSWIKGKMAELEIHRSIYITPRGRYMFDWSGRPIYEVDVGDGYKLGVVITQKPFDDIPYLLLVYKDSFASNFRFERRPYWIYGCLVNCPQTYDTLVELRVLPSFLSPGELSPEEMLQKIPTPVAFVFDCDKNRDEIMKGVGHMPTANPQLVDNVLKAYDGMMAGYWKEAVKIRDEKIEELKKRLADYKEMAGETFLHAFKQKLVMGKTLEKKETLWSKLSTKQKVGVIFFICAVVAVILFLGLSYALSQP